ncbi:Signal transduction histidine kinase [Acetitomaculum ruminis DSM 5522]|uniref:Circadian input-output histidine kinase CikA n=1 Tax=Acetitomaculum ruminis DSM 5522 TaxID=1120918 RepID=A0A1I0Y0H3_9FIRM|nr:ATP-binding protein [Acetitomaculum ruminis]SFB06831.1 Signal transduction histidine kinase [Acetitomaculum ruminis DSM 5522]
METTFFSIGLILTFLQFFCGITVLVLGIMTLIDNERSLANLLMFCLAVCVFFWNVGYGLMSVSYNEDVALTCRNMSMTAIVAFVTLSVTYMGELAGTNRKLLIIMDSFYIITGIFIWTLLTQKGVVTFVSTNYGYYYISGMSIGRILQAIYFFSGIFITAMIQKKWYERAVFKRNKVVILYLVLYEVAVLLGSIFDTIVPVLYSTPAVPSSGFGATVAFIVAYSISKKYKRMGFSAANFAKYIMAYVDTPVLMLGRDLVIISVNEAGIRYFSKSKKEDIIGKTAFEFLDLNIDTDELENRMREIVTNRAKSYTDQAKLYGMDNICKAVTSPVYDEYKEPVCAISFLYDMTHEVEIMKELNDKRQEADDANNVKSQFLANMSHEIRTPMNAIIGMSELALRGDIPEKEAEYIRQIRTAGRGLLTIINDILDFSKIESGKMEIVAREYSLSNLIEEIVVITFKKMKDKNLEYIINVDPDIPSKLFGDDGRIKQVILNVVNNAAKYTQEGSVILSIGAKMVDLSAVLEITVKDTGMGIREEDKEKLFKSFSQLDKIKNKNIEGTGLGLTISKQLVSLMNGEIIFESKYGEGSVFGFRLPQAVVDTAKSMQLKEEVMAIGYFSSPLERDFFDNLFTKLGVEFQFTDNHDEMLALCEGDADYAFVDENNMTEELAQHLEEWMIESVIITDSYKEYEENDEDIHFLTRPIIPFKVVEVLNGEDEYEKVITDTAYTVNFTAPKAEVLIVDDNLVNLTVAKGLLEPFKMHIDTARSGKTAIEMVMKKDYDIVFMDHMMPEMDGIEATANIRQLPDKKYWKLPIIALSANAVNGAKELFLSSNMNDFIAKPIAMSDMTQKLLRWLPPEKIIKDTVKKEEFYEDSEQARIDELPMDVINTEKAMSYVKHDEEQYKVVLTVYKEEIASKKDGIRNDIANGRLEAAKSKLHVLRNSSRNIGADDLADIAYLMEEAAGKEDMEFIEKHLDELFENIDSVEEVLNSFKVRKEHKANRHKDLGSVKLDFIDLKDNLIEKEIFTATKVLKRIKNKDNPIEVLDIIIQIQDYLEKNNFEEALNCTKDAIRTLNSL